MNKVAKEKTNSFELGIIKRISEIQNQEGFDQAKIGKHLWNFHLFAQ